MGLKLILTFRNYALKFQLKVVRFQTRKLLSYFFEAAHSLENALFLPSHTEAFGVKESKDLGND